MYYVDDDAMLEVTAMLLYITGWCMSSSVTLM